MDKYLLNTPLWRHSLRARNTAGSKAPRGLSPLGAFRLVGEADTKQRNRLINHLRTVKGGESKGIGKQVTLARVAAKASPEVALDLGPERGERPAVGRKDPGAERRGAPARAWGFGETVRRAGWLQQRQGERTGGQRRDHAGLARSQGGECARGRRQGRPWGRAGWVHAPPAPLTELHQRVEEAGDGHQEVGEKHVLQLQLHGRAATGAGAAGGSGGDDQGCRPPAASPQLPPLQRLRPAPRLHRGAGAGRVCSRPLPVIGAPARPRPE